MDNVNEPTAADFEAFGRKVAENARRTAKEAADSAKDTGFGLLGKVKAGVEDLSPNVVTALKVAGVVTAVAAVGGTAYYFLSE